MKPETKRAWLPSNGYSDNRPTMHRWVRNDYVPASELVGLQSIGREDQSGGLAQIYQCEETGIERRWGMVREDEHIS